MSTGHYLFKLASTTVRRRFKSPFKNTPRRFIVASFQVFKIPRTCNGNYPGAPIGGDIACLLRIRAETRGKRDPGETSAFTFASRVPSATVRAKLRRINSVLKINVRRKRNRGTPEESRYSFSCKSIPSRRTRCACMFDLLLARESNFSRGGISRESGNASSEKRPRSVTLYRRGRSAIDRCNLTLRPGRFLSTAWEANEKRREDRRQPLS